jgi:uncharacterized protein
MDTDVNPNVLPGDEPYWSYMSSSELRAQCCDDCGTLRFPSAPVCPSCLSEAAHWKRLSGRGRTFAWTRFHRTYLPAHPAPYTVISVEVDEGLLLIGKLLGDAPEIGQPVRAVFEASNDPSGPSVICHWEPDPENSNEGNPS